MFNKPLYSNTTFNEEGTQSINILWPGSTKKDFDIKVVDSTLFVSSGEYKEKFVLTDKVNLKGITASYEGGILSISFPRKKSDKPISIEVD